MPEPQTGAATDSATDLVGQVLAGRYRILQKLGEGAMGAVFVGEHVRMGRRDAIKVLRGPLASDAEAIRRFNRGARNVSAVRHPNVCTIYDFSDTAEGVTFLAMELITGESLKELIEREGALPVPRAVSIARQTADALQAAHDAGIVHRDLKPANIMLMRDRVGGDLVKVVDFDIAKGYDEAEGNEVTRVGFVVGTPEYMSPEQLMGERLDGRSDLYSLGLVLFRMLTGSLPFRADTPQDLMVQRLTHKPLLLQEVAPAGTFPPGLQAAIERSLALKPSDRQACAADFAHEIVAAIAGTTTATSAATPVAPTVVAPAASSATGAAATAVGAATSTAGTSRAFRGRNRTLVLVGGVALVVVAAGGTALLVRGRPGKPAADAQPPVAVETSPAGPQGSGTTSPAAAQGGGPPGPAAQPGVSTTQTPAGSGSSAPAGGGTPGSVAGGESSPTAGSGSGSQALPAVKHERARAPSGAIVVADPRATLFRQFDRLGPPYPSAGVVRAIRDTASAVWDATNVATEQRAFAAYVIANTYVVAGADNATIVLWLQRAVSLNPNGPGYRKQLDAYQGQSR